MWRAGLILLGNPPTDVVLGMLFYGPPDSNDRLNVAFHLADAKDLHQALGELLHYVDPGRQSA